jgi:hypothetical protein
VKDEPMEKKLIKISVINNKAESGNSDKKWERYLLKLITTE